MLRATPRARRKATFYDPDPGTVHVLDMHRDHSLHYHRLSDHAVGMLWYGLIESAITQTDVCDFRMSFENNLKFREPRDHDGRPFLGPDGLTITLRNEPMNGGDDSLQTSALSGAEILNHPNYKTWVSNLLYRGGERTNSLHHEGIIAGTIRAPVVDSAESPPPVVRRDVRPSGPASPLGAQPRIPPNATEMEGLISSLTTQPNSREPSPATPNTTAASSSYAPASAVKKTPPSLKTPSGPSTPVPSAVPVANAPSIAESITNALPVAEPAANARSSSESPTPKALDNHSTTGLMAPAESAASVPMALDKPAPLAPTIPNSPALPEVPFKHALEVPTVPNSPASQEVPSKNTANVPTAVAPPAPQVIHAVTSADKSPPSRAPTPQQPSLEPSPPPFIPEDIDPSPPRRRSARLGPSRTAPSSSQPKATSRRKNSAPRKSVDDDETSDDFADSSPGSCISTPSLTAEEDFALRVFFDHVQEDFF